MAPPFPHSQMAEVELKRNSPQINKKFFFIAAEHAKMFVNERRDSGEIERRVFDFALRLMR